MARHLSRGAKITGTWLYVSFFTKPTIFTTSGVPSRVNVSPMLKPLSFKVSLTITFCRSLLFRELPSMILGSRKEPGMTPSTATSTFCSSSFSALSLSIVAIVAPIGAASVTLSCCLSSAINDSLITERLMEAREPFSKVT
ncbi:hypothetical protein D3C81_1397270 [compost metagenome]